MRALSAPAAPGRLLLAGGIRAVEGNFAARWPVRATGQRRRELGQGLCTLSQENCARSWPQAAMRCAAILGAVGDAGGGNRDQLVLNAALAGNNMAPINALSWTQKLVSPRFDSECIYNLLCGGPEAEPCRVERLN